MKRKVIISLFVIVILTISRYYIINAANETSEVEILTNVDAEKNITLNLQASNIKGIEGIISYDSDILEYVGIEEQNSWIVDINQETLQFLVTSENDDNTEKKDIAIIKFKPKNTEDILETNISITSITIVKEDGTSSEVEDLNTTVTISANVDTDEKDEFADDGEIKEDVVAGEEDNVITEGDVTIDYGGDSQVDEETNENGEEVEAGESVEANESSFEGGSEEEYQIKVTEDDVAYKEEGVLKDEAIKQADDIANKNLPQTGTKGVILTNLIMAVLLAIAYVAYKKYKRV